MVQFSRFASPVLCIQTGILYEYSGFPHSDIAGSLLFCQLLRAFRRLTRPSSPIIAKASTWCTYSLDSIIWRTFDFVSIGVDNHSILGFFTLIKLTAVVVCGLCLLCFTNHLIQSSPKFVLFVVFDLLAWPCVKLCFSGCLKWVCKLFQTQSNQHCLCLLISAFQFVKDRCVLCC